MTMAKRWTHEEWVKNAERLGTFLPQKARRFGWDLRDFSIDMDTRDTAERYSVRVTGPVEATTREVAFIGGETTFLLEVSTGTHGILRARSFEDLCRLVAEWVAAVWPEKYEP